MATTDSRLYRLVVSENKKQNYLSVLNKFDPIGGEYNLDHATVCYQSEFALNRVEVDPFAGQYLRISGEVEVVFDTTKEQVVYVRTHSEGKGSEYGQVIGEKYVYQVDRDMPELGMILVDLSTGEMEEQLEIPFIWPTYLGSGLFWGVTRDFSIEVYSLEKRKVVFILDVDKYCGEYDGTQDVQASLAGTKLAFSIRNKLIHLDLLELEVIDYLDVSTIEAFKEDFRGTLFESGANFLGTPKIINIDGGIYLDSNWEYLAYVDFENSSKSWVQALNDVDFCKFFGGDLLVGKKHSRPTVWDRYSGKVVWQSNNSVAANKVQIVGEYIVYSSYTGDVNAFRIDKEYKSPSRW